MGGGGSRPVRLWGVIVIVVCVCVVKGEWLAGWMDGWRMEYGVWGEDDGVYGG